MKRRSLFLIMIISGILTISGCASQPAQAPAPTPEPAAPAAAEPAPAQTPQVTEMTLAELAQYNGKDGARAYVAVDGVIYDVTDVPPWKGGTHQGKVEAGIDASEMIKQSPHGKKVLEKLPVVGKIKQ